MDRLSKTAREFIENALSYTEEQLLKITSTHTIMFHIAGRMFQRSFDPFMYATIIGMTQQMDNFELRHGILYYIDADTMDVKAYAVELDKDKFFAQPHIIKKLQ